MGTKSCLRQGHSPDLSSCRSSLSRWLLGPFSSGSYYGSDSRIFTPSQSTMCPSSMHAVSCLHCIFASSLNYVWKQPTSTLRTSSLSKLTEQLWAHHSHPCIVANLYMETFEKKAITSAIVSPRLWFRYVDDTFVIWPHSVDLLEEFHQHLNK